jgi:outer membrane protein
MKSYFKNILLLSVVYFPLQRTSARAVKTDSLLSIPLTLNQVWERAASYNKAVQMKQLHLESSVEQIKNAKAERLPDINIEGEYARISNMPVYENGIFKSPTQFEVLHSTYTVGADAYLNIYNGNKLNIEIEARKSENKIAAEQKKLTLSDVKLRAAA